MQQRRRAEGAWRGGERRTERAEVLARAEPLPAGELLRRMRPARGGAQARASLGRLRSEAGGEGGEVRGAALQP